jgi:hypothetical protein
MTKKNPISKSITSALIIQTNQIIFNELVRLLDLETDKKPSSMSDFKNYDKNDLENFREYSRLRKDRQVGPGGSSVDHRREGPSLDSQERRDMLQSG